MLEIMALSSVSVWDQMIEFFMDYIWFPLSNIGIINILDILLLGQLIYIVYKFVRDRHAGRTIIGLGLLLLLYVVSDLLGMVAINSILQNF